tara:strand:- start:113 stop:319 length:207 start_codon:yes stop_codon:yes gene_type:complete
MANGKTSLHAVMEKLDRIDKRLKKVEQNISSEVELEQVARKIAEEEKNMKRARKRYVTEAQVKKQYGL